ncbi:MAG: polysaccharide biosynthesis protein [Clostridia bacterium]|nr:polysaccharide biosynthesis protein [Clostridia bacterium]
MVLFFFIFSWKTGVVKFGGGLGVIAVTSLVYFLVLIWFDVYRTNWVYANSREYTTLLTACTVSAAISIVLGLIVGNEHIYLKLNVASNIVTTALVCAFRFFLRISYNLTRTKDRKDAKKALIIGAGSLAMAFLRDLQNNDKLNYEVVGLIDDDESKMNISLHGAKVLGNRFDIDRICKTMDVEEIIFAIYSLDNSAKTKLLDICSNTGKKVKILQSMASNLGDVGPVSAIRDVDIEDLLERDPIVLDNTLIQGDIFGKTVLVTGAGGSIGSELCRQIIKYNPEKLIILDIYENSLYDLQNELEEQYPNQNIVALIASVRDKARLDIVFGRHKPDIVFHAAAHKHVPLMEDSPCEAIKNNILGTYNVALCAKEFGVKRFVLISTDKAVNPTNIMGASKRMCEMIIQTLQKNSTTEFVAVRFGNVLGSNGSVIPRFKKQIENGGPITVTHPEITRFFMTIPEAAQLVLQAAAYAKGGEIFVLDMGKPVKIYDLACKMIILSGLVPNKDIEIKFTGLRQGEKLYEELLMNEEGLLETKHNKIFIGKPIDMEIEELEEKLSRLKSVINTNGNEIKKIVAEVVPTYHIFKRDLETEHNENTVLSAN